MNPETKVVLEALTQRFESLEASVKESGAKWVRRIEREMGEGLR
jgi:hypothetical protein